MVRACSFSFWMRVLNDIDRNLLPVKSKGEKRIARGDLIVSAGEGEVFCLLTQRGFKLGPTLTQLSFDNCRRRRMCFSEANQHFICATVFCMTDNHNAVCLLQKEIGKGGGPDIGQVDHIEKLLWAF